MKLKGTMVVELTDVNTSETETITEENMVTNAVNNILGLNPMGIFYQATGEYDDAVLWNGSLLPICPNMIGGILLFSKTLEEDADNIYALSDNLPVAYASNNAVSYTHLANGYVKAKTGDATTEAVYNNWYKSVYEPNASPTPEETSNTENA